MRPTVSTRSRRAAPLAFVALVTLPAWTGLAHAEALAIDPNHSHVGFSIRHFFTQVKGEFKSVSGTIDVDASAPSAARVAVDIDPATINTNNDRRDNHLRSADFFDVAKFPKMTFVATSVNLTDPKEFKGTLTGDLTMHGVTKPVTLTLTGGGMQSMGANGTIAGFAATGTLNRKDYGIVWNKVFDQGPAMLGDDVALEIDVEAKTPMQPKPVSATVPAPAPQAPPAPATSSAK